MNRYIDDIEKQEFIFWCISLPVVAIVIYLMVVLVFSL